VPLFGEAPHMITAIYVTDLRAVFYFEKNFDYIRKYLQFHLKIKFFWCFQKIWSYSKNDI